MEEGVRIESEIETPVPSAVHVTVQDIEDAERAIRGSFGTNLWNALKKIFKGNFRGVGGVGHHSKQAGWFVVSYFSNLGSNFMFPYMNFVRGFHKPSHWMSENLAKKVRKTFAWLWKPWRMQTDQRFKPPVKGEKMNVVSYAEVGRQFDFVKDYPFFERYYTGMNVPSNEDNEGHADGIKWLDRSVKISGKDAIKTLYDMEPRLAFDKEALIKATWDGFKYFGPRDIKYASNGIFGWDVMDDLMGKEETKDALGILMTYSVFGAHLVYDDSSDTFSLDLEWLDAFDPLEGYARLGGNATFKYDAGKRRLVTKSLSYGGSTFEPTDSDEEVNRAFEESRLVGWMFAEKAIIASLLSMTNLVMHVKDLHLELAAAFQATTFDAFSDEPTHPIRRLLDPFIHRSAQATNDNFKLLFEYRAAEFSLAPLPYEGQLELIDQSIHKFPLSLAAMDMENFAIVRNMKPEFSSSDGGDGFRWQWHYRALTVQRLYRDLIKCWLDRNFGEGKIDFENDKVLNDWWRDLRKYIPAFRRAVESDQPGYDARFEEWGKGGTLDRDTLTNLISTVATWVSWIHEDVGHSAAAYVYNPVHTPMCVPEDGIGVPLRSHAFNVAAYRGFVFLHRAVLLEDAADHWFDAEKEDRVCFETFQDALRELGKSDPAFSQCDDKGFYSCVDRVETAVSS